ncbi:Beta-lactamase-related protein [Penicillium brevicompactum]|uniref:Beta-lactamase-related protein n=1 Tax=Penicillium brevicompactum TaxID=5074 RepID=UPI002541474F|nr:Beta-lactamase-related protein [Penicillium brevicompactum]KAJ5343681.1 Beta-lactamase-related protein [Penicillium brevicompactum]
MLWTKWLLLLASTHAQSTPDCPILGAAYPAPRALSKDPTFLAATQKISTRLNTAIDNENLSSVSFALQIFSSHESDPAYGFYLTDDLIKNGNVGVTEVDENTIFRIGSVSKLWTMFLYMTFGGIRYFYEPVSKYVPELRVNQSLAQSTNAIDHIKWDGVTIGELASHQAGVLRDYAFMDLSFQQKTLQIQGFPALAESQQLTCGNAHLCDRKGFFDGILQSLYSNAGYQILGYAMEAILNSSYEKILMDRLIEPLNLTRSSLHTPDPALAVVPYNESFSFFNFEFGDEASAGAIYSSAKDMSTFGRAILSNKLVDPSVTRQWMKPITHTSSIRQAVGAPWEIYSFSTPRRTDLYTKAGDIGMYSSFIGLSPDHDAGFSVLLAGSNSHQSTAMISEIVSDILLPTLDLVARNQALERFGGTYQLATDGSNSSITITADDSPGLKIESWISNSVDMYATLMSMQKVTDRSAMSIRLQPTGLQTGTRIGFAAVIYSQPTPPNAGPITGSCFSWQLLESFIYGNVALSEFEFEVNDDGNATSVSPRALRITLPRL